MKKLILSTIVVLLTTSCNYNPDKRSITTVIHVENANSKNTFGKYKYTLFTSYSDKRVTTLFSDEVYKLNDTLKMVKISK